MSKTILIELKAKDNASKVLEKTEKNLKDLDKSTKEMGYNIKASTAGAHESLAKLGNQFRFMSIAFGMLAAGSIGLVKSFVNSAKEMEAATLRIGVFAASTGQSIEGAQQIALDFASTGLVSVTEASNTLSNLLATGLNLDTAKKLMQGMLDTAVLSKESLTDTYGRALEKSSLGIRILQERQVDAIGINFTAIQVWREYGKTIGKTTNEMSTQEKQMAIVNHLLKETERFAGGADLAMQTFGGAMSRLSTVVEIMKAKLGATLIPLIGSFADALSFLSKKISEMAEKYPALVSIVITGTVAFVAALAALVALGAIVPLISIAFTKALIPAFTKVTIAGTLMGLRFFAIAVAVGLLMFIVLKATGLWDKWTGSMKRLTDRIRDTIKEFSNFGEESTEAADKLKKKMAELDKQIFITTRTFREGLAEWAKKNTETTEKLTKDIKKLEDDYKAAIDKINEGFIRSNEDATISHQRKVEDIKRQLDEEVSKGIWADQTKIRDLERSLKRENEDFARHQEGLKSDKDKDLKEEKSRFEEKRKELQTELDKEELIRATYQGVLKKYAIEEMILVDEVMSKYRTYVESLGELEEKQLELTNSTEEMGGAMSDMFNTGSIGADGLANELNKPISKIQQLQIEFDEARRRSDLLDTAGGRLAEAFIIAGEKMIKSTETLGDKWKSLGEKLFSYLKPDSTEQPIDVGKSNILGKGALIKGRPLLPNAPQFGLDFAKGAIRTGIDFTKYLLSDPREHGGPVSKNKPYVVGEKGPELFIPNSSGMISPNNGQSVTININNPTVRSDSDISRIAEQVKAVLSRGQFLRQFK